jgi:membrane protease subunit HflK
MPWNEPGGSNKDPWSKKPSNQGPPDLDELLRKLTGKFGGIFGGKPGGGGGGFGKIPSTGLGLILAVIGIIWLGSGFYIVSAGEAGVVLRFQAFHEVTGPGPHWHLPYPIEAVEVINIDAVREAQHKATMLTQDENIIDIELAVQYRIKSPEDYLFQVRIPDASVKLAMESSVREVVGKSKMDYILGEGRAEIAQDTQKSMQGILDYYQTGLILTTVNMQQAQPPEQVQGAFADAIKAREDEVRFKNEAEAYANGITPQARGEAARFEQEASAYKERVIANAEGEAGRFLKLLGEYQKAPEVTRERMYIDAVQEVLSNSSKVMMDVKGGNSLFYLPVDKLIREGGAGALSSGEGLGGVNTGSSSSGAMDSRSRRSSTRLREER